MKGLNPSSTILSSLKKKSFCFNRNLSSEVREKSWKSVVGLEIHAQIQSTSKLFSGSGTDFRAATNRSVALFDAAFPGTLPVLNKRCVEAGVLTAMALSCNVNAVSSFDRKHYFYSDLPAGYQITQHRSPLGSGGFLTFIVDKVGKEKTLYEKTSHLHQIQLEQDSGRSLHDDDRSLVDLNRAGIPLMELVFEPDLADGEEAACLVKELCLVLTRLGTCSCKMEEGAMRVDANVSVHKEGTPLGVRTEVKNIGSIRAVANAIDFEIKRQISMLESGKIVVNETRSWDAVSFTTVPMRDKEEKQDYRYMPEPNLPPLHLHVENSTSPDPNMVNVWSLKSQIPESPQAMRQRFQRDFCISLMQAFRLVNEDRLLPLFQDAMSEKKERDAVILVNLLLNDVLTYYNAEDGTCFDFRTKDLGYITDMLQEGSISKSLARKILEELYKSSDSTAREIVEKNDWILFSDPHAIEQLCKSVMDENQDIVKKHISGKKNQFKSLHEKAWKKSDAKANMDLVKAWFENNLPFKKK